MSYPFQDCCAPCPSTVQATNVPGAAGATGAAGEDGENGISSYTITTANFIVPAVDANVTVSVGTSLWMVVDQNIFMEGPANFQVVSLPGPGSVVLKFLGYTGDVSPGVTITAGTGVSVGGLEGIAGPVDDPLLIANGGTSANTKAGAQLNIGVGQSSTQAALTSSTQIASAGAAFTSATAVGNGATLTIATTGRYQVQVRCRIDAASATLTTQTITIELRKGSGALTNGTVTLQVLPITTTSGTIANLHVFTEADFTAADTLNLYATFSAVTGAGTVSIVAATLQATPIRLS